MMNPQIRFKKPDRSDYQDYIAKEMWEVTSWDKSFNDVDKSKQPVKCSFKHVSAETLKNLKCEGPVTLLSTGQFRGTTSVEKANDYLNKGEVIALPSGGEAGVKYCNGLFVDSGNILATASRTQMVDMKYLFEYLYKHIDYIRSCYRGVSIKHPKMSDILDMRIYIPADIEEQTKIANFLLEIDKLIQSAENELEATKQLKKAMLQKMFPKKGEKVPEVRFPGFTGDWEQRKFGDVFEEYSEKNHEDLPPLTIVQGSGTIPREESGRDIKYDKSSLNNYKLVNPGDFILHLRSFEGGLEVANSQGIVSPAYHIFRGIRTDSRFYYPFFRSHDFINILLKPHVYGIRDGKSIDVEGMKSIKIPYPDFDEQKRIGDFFDHLDNAITLHQRKLDAYKKFKKAMMQKMFV